MDLNKLLERTVPFKFEFEDFVITGEMWKYKTQTPIYAKSLISEGEETEEDREEHGYQAIADTIKTWDLQKDGTDILPSVASLKELPAPVLRNFIDFVGETRDGNPTKNENNSPNS